ncbi:hypothetical protein [uncultured Mucilaginibacter sp.]|uniref:hypothetical protein n=1 Tax=uncultured Mucilaginibacter sp. TaxID=797541 RepID=UPI0025E76C5B|nr:hypothetical protein [uncultured Mucilaginibacter sp.]
MKKYIVEVIRIAKNSPFNCIGFFPELIASDEDAAVNSPGVIACVCRSFGKNIKVVVSPMHEDTYTEYLFNKSAAVVREPKVLYS